MAFIKRRSGGGHQRGRARDARREVLDRFDAQREVLVSRLGDVAGGLLEDAARRLPGGLGEPVLAAGSRVLEEAASRLQEGSAEDLVQAAQRRLMERPGLSMLGLMGVGVLAGRLVRVSLEEGAAA